MNREDIMKMTTEELCALRTPEEINAYSTGRPLIDPEFDAFINERLGQLAEPYVKEVHAGFAAGQRDLSEMVERFDNEPPLVKIHAWTRVTEKGIAQVELAKYAHRYLARSVLRVFQYEPSDKELNDQQKTFNRYIKRT